MALALAPQFSSAAALTDVFKGVTYAQPKCYGREYSETDLKTNPAQTVTQIKAKLMKYSADPKAVSEGLKIEVRLKGEEGLNYHAEFSCMTDPKGGPAGAVFCAIDCDGGSVTVGSFDSKTMTLKSNGFTIQGGCGEDGVTKRLAAAKHGDDIFKLYALPQAFCSDANTHFE